MYNKILITGNAGSGKTTLSYQVAEILHINEVIHLDKIVWEGAWKPVSKERREESFSQIVKKESWLVEGVSKTVLNNADTILFLDYSRHVCYFRALKRTFRYAFRSRPELPKQSLEIFVLGKLLKIIWNFPNTVKPMILNHLTEHSDKKAVFHIRNKHDLRIFLNLIKQSRVKLSANHFYSNIVSSN